MTSPEITDAAVEAERRFTEQFGDGRELSEPLHAYWYALDGKTGELGYTWSDKPHRLVFDLLAYARFLERKAAALAAGRAEDVAVKPLEWPDECPRGKRIKSKGGLIQYTILLYGGSNPEWPAIYRWARHEGGWSDPCETYEAAKAAAQQDFDQRIRSALVSAPAAEAEPGSSFWGAPEHERGRMLSRIRELETALPAPSASQEALREALAMPSWTGWRSIDTAPEDQHVILATAGGFVGEAIMLIDEDTGGQKWAWALGPVHPNHQPYGWMPLPDPLRAPVASDLRPDGFDGPTGAE